MAYCLDRAVLTFGTALDNELQSVKGKTDKEREVKRQRVISRFIPEAGGPRYRDPARRSS